MFSAQVGGLLGGGVLGLFLLGLICRRVTNSAAIIATVLGVMVITWMSLSRWPIWPDTWAVYRSPWHEMMAGVVGTAVIIGVGLLLTWGMRFTFKPRATAAVVATRDEPTLTTTPGSRASGQEFP
jgi:Na+/proline symporter